MRREVATVAVAVLLLPGLSAAQELPGAIAPAPLEAPFTIYDLAFQELMAGRRGQAILCLDVAKSDGSPLAARAKAVGRVIAGSRYFPREPGAPALTAENAYHEAFLMLAAGWRPDAERLLHWIIKYHQGDPAALRARRVLTPPPPTSPPPPPPQQGVCFQCVELDSFFGANQGDPLAGTPRDLDARLAVLRDLAAAPLGPWHRQMMRLVDEVLGGA